MLMAILYPLSLSGIAGIKGVKVFCLCKTYYVRTYQEQGEENFHAILFFAKIQLNQFSSNVL
jgi:hypothetical protein